MTDPRIEGSLGDLNFRAPSRPMARRNDASGYFWLGVAIFIGVALVYPFYSYQVQARLLAREMSAAISDAAVDMDALAREAQRQSLQVASQAAAQSASQRQRGVVVAGTTIIGDTRVVIVQLGQASLREATASICRQAEAYFSEPLAGERLRVQRHRGSRPAVDAGTILCE